MHIFWVTLYVPLVIYLYIKRERSGRAFAASSAGDFLRHAWGPLEPLYFIRALCLRAVAAPAPADPQLGPYLIARGARAGGKTINQTPRCVAKLNKSVLAVLGAFTQRARRQGYVCRLIVCVCVCVCLGVGGMCLCVCVCVVSSPLHMSAVKVECGMIRY